MLLAPLMNTVCIVGIWPAREESLGHRHASCRWLPRYFPLPSRIARGMHEPVTAASPQSATTTQLCHATGLHGTLRANPPPMHGDQSGPERPALRCRRHAGRAARLGDLRKPHLRCCRGQPDDGHRRPRPGDRRRARGARRRAHGLRRLRARHVPAPHAERAGHPGDGPPGYRAPDRHTVGPVLPARERQGLGTRHPGYEGRQLPGARSDPPASPRPRPHEASRHRAADQRRGSRQSLHPRPDRGGSVPPSLHPGTGTRSRRRRRRDRPLRYRAVQSGGARPPQPCRCAARRGPLRDPRNGPQDRRNRGHDHATTAPSASASSMAGSG